MRQAGKNYTDMGHSRFLNSTCDIGEISDRDMRHCYFLKSTCNIGDPPIKGLYSVRLTFDSGSGELRGRSRAKDLSPFCDVTSWPLAVSKLIDADRFPLQRNKVAAEAKVAWPHSGTSVVGVNQRKPKMEPRRQNVDIDKGICENSFLVVTKLPQLKGQSFSSGPLQIFHTSE